MMDRSAVGRPKLLFLSQTLPFPPDGGVKIRTYNILRLLARRFDITALCFYRQRHVPNGAGVERSLAGLRELGRFSAFRIDQEWSRARLLRDHLRSVVARRTYTAFAYRSHDFQRSLTTLLERESFDLIHADSLDLSYYFPQLAGIPIACTHHDVTSLQLARRSAREEDGFRRLYVRHQATLMEKEERIWCERVALNVAVSRTDADALQRIAPGGRYAVIPNGVDTEYFNAAESGGRGIVCVGGMTWFPNRDALEHFAHDILPFLGGDDRPPVYWVGRASKTEIQEYRHRYGIELTGYVDDVRPYIRSAACYVVPIRVGGGTRVKILDAWAMGRAIVSTSIGCEGLDAVDGGNILIRDDPKEFADAVHQVLRDPQLRRRLGQAGREMVERTYSWEVIGEELIRRYEQALDGGARQVEAPTS
jgi:polysaccharide biosynthesis protein PslH